MLRFTALLVLLLSLVPILMARPGSIKLTPGELKHVMIGGMPRFTKNHDGLVEEILECSYNCFFTWDPVCSQFGEQFINKCHMNLQSCLDGYTRYVLQPEECRRGGHSTLRFDGNIV